MSQQNTTPLPLYASHKLIETRVAPVSRSLLNQWARQGWLRTVKTGTNRQSARLYSVRDLIDCLERIAQGYAPRRKRRQ